MPPLAAAWLPSARLGADELPIALWCPAAARPRSTANATANLPITLRTFSSLLHYLLKHNTGIQERVQHVGHDIDEHDDDRGKEHRAHDHRDIVILDCLIGELADSWP